MRSKQFYSAIVSLLAAPAVWAQWSAPIGIPEPPIGVREMPAMYAGQTGYANAGNGPYTHYVDSTAANCTSSGNGTATQPRCSIPTSLPAGAVVEIHGGPYSFTAGTVISASGTSARPVFVRGVGAGENVPVIRNSDRLDFSGSYLIVEDLAFQGIYVRMTGSNMALRRVQIYDHPSKNGSILDGQNMVLMNSHIHHNQGNDRHGTTVGSGSNGVWILDNYYHHNGGDAVQFCHQCSSAPPRNVYIGRNTMHSDRENGVDLKFAENVVVSQNIISSYRSAPADTQWCFDDGSGCGVFTSGSDGAAVVIGSDGGPRNVWIIFNEIHGSDGGIRIEEGYDVGLIGNVIYDIAGRAIGLDKVGQPLYVAHNTISGVEIGIDQNWRDTFDVTIDNNIFENISSQYIRVESNPVADSAQLRNNVFWKGGAAVPIQWIRAESATTGSQINSLTGGSANVVADPRFVNRASGNFRLREGSPAIDAGNTILAQYDATFRQAFGGATLLRDADGVNRPLDGDGNRSLGHDVGAFEFGGGIAPEAPTALVVQ